MELLGGYLNLSGGELSENGPGGALMAAGESILRLEDSAFTANFSEADGGAISLACEAGIVERCEFRGNQTKGSGGAISDRADFGVQVDACSFFENRAQKGGANFTSAGIGETTVSGSIFHGNTSQSGGAMYLGERPVDIVRCTLASNRAPLGSQTVAKDTRMVYRTRS